MISAVSATFFGDFSGCFAVVGELFCGFQRFQLLFPEFFRLFNVYPMSRTFSFLFSKYLDTKFYGIPGFIQ